ncbi:MAG: T9SS type A sorting domain-containing protein [Bacteriovoracaceae bacterium]|nr:T9SS type A sorting domain-containing protein [Bacteriovoracaceae bacterium]
MATINSNGYQCLDFDHPKISLSVNKSSSDYHFKGCINEVEEIEFLEVDIEYDKPLSDLYITELTASIYLSNFLIESRKITIPYSANSKVTISDFGFSNPSLMKIKNEHGEIKVKSVLKSYNSIESEANISIKTSHHVPLDFEVNYSKKDLNGAFLFSENDDHTLPLQTSFYGQDFVFSSNCSNCSFSGSNFKFDQFGVHEISLSSNGSSSSNSDICYDSVTKKINVLGETLDVTIFPNPMGFSDTLKIKTSNPISNFQAKLFDLNGRLIWSKDFKNVNLSANDPLEFIPANTFTSAGLYVVQIFATEYGYVKTFKIIVDPNP